MSTRGSWHPITRKVGLPVQDSGDKTLAFRPVAEAALPGGVRGTLTRTLTLLAVTVGLMLLLAVANVGALQLVRHEARRRELGVRLALGASRGRLLRQFLFEAVALACVTAGVALLLATWMTDVLSSLALSDILPVALEVGFDGWIIGFAVALSASAALACGLVPAWHTTKRDLLLIVRESHAGSRVVGGRLLWRRLLIIAQTATCTVLLVCTVLFVVTLQREQAIDLGFDTNPIVLTRINQTLARQAVGNRDALFRQLIDRVRSLPEVTSVASAQRPPLAQNYFTTLVSLSDDAEKLRAKETSVSQDYFRTLGIPLRGKGFTSDTAEQEVIVNEALAARLWKSEDPLGETLMAVVETGGTHQVVSREVVGVARNTTYQTLHDSHVPIVYRPIGRERYGYMLVKSAVPVEALMPRLRETFTEVAPNLPIELSRLRQHVEGWLARPRALAMLVGGFSVLAWLLALAGLYGLLSYLVARRTREIGVRIALGADQRHLLNSVLRQGGTLAATGAALGLLAAISVARFVRGFLYGVEPTDPSVLAAVGVGVLLVALAASFIPARRAAAVHPVEALRTE